MFAFIFFSEKYSCRKNVEFNKEEEFLGLPRKWVQFDPFFHKIGKVKFFVKWPVARIVFLTSFLPEDKKAIFD